MTTKMALVTEYDGARYHGLQLQANVPTVQGELERALWRLTGERTRVMAASRTDAGVHAKGQVVSFRTDSSLPSQTFVRGLNHYLSRDIAVKKAYKVNYSFNVRRDAISREYHYCILNRQTRAPLMENFSYRVAEELDVELMNQACQALIGEHNFASFASSVGDEVKSMVRIMHQTRVEKKGELIILTMVANSFLPHQVRNTVGALVKVGLGKVNVDAFHSIMEAKRLGLAGPAARACGLCLMRVNYPHSLREESSEDV